MFAEFELIRTLEEIKPMAKTAVKRKKPVAKKAAKKTMRKPAKKMAKKKAA